MPGPVSMGMFNKEKNESNDLTSTNSSNNTHCKVKSEERLSTP